MRSLETGQELTIDPWTMDSATVEAYLEAVGQEATAYSDAGVVPPMAVAGRTLGTLIEDLSMPPGSIHIGQDLEFMSPVKPGQDLTCSARLARESKRGGWRILVLEFSVGPQDSVVLKGRTTVMVPLEEGSR